MQEPTDMTLPQLQDEANTIRRGGLADPKRVLEIAKRLANANQMDEARLLANHLAQSLTDSQDLSPAWCQLLGQKWALWTSKNPDAPDDSKHDEALSILRGPLMGSEGLSKTADPETLGIAGGIYKRMWQVDGRRQTLERSLDCYERGAKAGVAADNGYNAINTAFVLDLLASLAMNKDEVEALRQRAAQWRTEVRDALPNLADKPISADNPTLRRTQPFFWETLAEAHFGLMQYDQATVALKQAYAMRKSVRAPVVEGMSEVDQAALAATTTERMAWEIETTARQFAWLARLQAPEARKPEDFAKSPAWQVLHEVYGQNTSAAARSLFAGKLGVSLSGGGFRASLFHIGVLAALAERDMLRHVEVLSCVSGGAILGAHYYLEVRQLLQSKADGEITRQDYIDLVERMACEFLLGVQKNMRVRIGTSLWANLKMLFKPGYTTTSRLAELYEEHLFARVNDDGKRMLRELHIQPKGEQNFKPKYGNWQRDNKVPILILNATSLNTGHNWQFTTSWMGEPPSAIDSHIDGNYRLRRMYIADEAPEPHRDIRLSQAVAASACVPGLFTPLELPGLYPDVTVRLVDGGVHDNQGIYGLLDQNCNVMLVSDASGQMSTVDQPSDGPMGVLLRTTALLQARIRVACYREIEARRKSGRLRGMLFLHLKQGLEVEPRDWVECDNPKESSNDDLRMQSADLTEFQVLKRVQAKLAGIRTDLDSFTDAEAFALMTSGCNMVRTYLDKQISGFSAPQPTHAWPFLRDAAPMLKDNQSSKALEQFLSVSGMVMFKLWRLSLALRWLSYLMLALVVVMLLWAAWAWSAESGWKGSVSDLACTALKVALTALGFGGVVKLISLRKTVHQVLTGAAFALLGTLITNLHVRFFDGRFLKRGSIARIKRKSPPPDQSA
jgi:predicted acylesterase/phospholipase RssA